LFFLEQERNEQGEVSLVLFRTGMELAGEVSLVLFRTGKE
jgi:hypothetical protein